MAPKEKGVAQPKDKMRTSEDVFNRVRWDEAFGAHDSLIIGYEDRLEGPMEMNFSAFLPLSEGGNIPFHRIWYFRRGDDGEVLWDRRRRFDLVFESGDTSAILADRTTKKAATGFDRVADQRAEQETAKCIKQAQDTMARIEEERLELLEKRRRAKARKAAARANSTLGNATNLCPIADLCEEVSIQAFGHGCDVIRKKNIRIASWNVLNDDHIEETLHPPSLVRAPLIAAALFNVHTDIVALQEVTDPVMDALLDGWAQQFWSVRLSKDLAIVSCHPIIRAVSVNLGPAKRALLAHILVQGKVLVLANVHFTSDRRGNEFCDNSEKRRAQAKQVRSALSHLSSRDNILICGDFNEPGRSGLEAAASCMEGLADGWVVVHGSDNGGFSFDPARNNLANLGALQREPRRLDRIFASPCFTPQDASLFAQEGELSDHFGVFVDFVRESALFSKPVVTSALAIVTPKDTWAQINAIRERYDPSFTRWMPHINLIYGFLPEEHFDVASLAAEKVTRRHGPIAVVLESMELFEHGRSCSLVAIPSAGAEAIMELQAELVALFPTCAKDATHSFQPHLTLGKFDSVDEARRVKAELDGEWRPLAFVIEDVAFLARSSDHPFSIPTLLPLGSALSEQDVGVLQLLESNSGARAFPVGSAAILGGSRSAGSDFDVVMVGTEPSEVIFSALEHLDAEWSRRVDAKFPILQMQLGSMQLDIQYARSSNFKHPLHWPDFACEEGGHSVAAIWDVYAVRSAILRARGFQGWAQYQQALLFVKKWAKTRGIGSNALGYLGGFSWALLLANTALSPDAPTLGSDGDALARAMWKRFAAWNWPDPVVLERRVSSCNDVMPILCPTDSGANSARNVTCSTILVLQAELQLAANGIKPVSVLQEVLLSFPKFICCEVRAAGVDNALCAHWLEARLIVLVRKLATVFARPLRVGAGLWIIGIATENLGLPLVQRVVLSLLSMPDPSDVVEASSYLHDLDPSLSLTHSVLAELTQQLSSTQPSQHCSILESFGVDLFHNSTAIGPPALDRLITKDGGPAVPIAVTQDWVNILLRNSQMRLSVCASSFKKHSRKNGGVLHEEGTLQFCEEICSKLGIAVAKSKLESAVAKTHRNKGEGLNPDEFDQFFERFLRNLSTQLPKGSLPEGSGEQANNETSTPDVMEAVVSFRSLVDRGEWRALIDISVDDSATLQQRL